jgi:nucleotide-binding universal stress UspA family protein
MIDRVLLAVDDTAASLAAARLATELCARWRAALFVTSAPAGAPEAADAPAAGTARRSGDDDELRAREARDVLGYVARLAQRQGVNVRTELLDGEPAFAILDRCERIGADLVIIGRSRTVGYGQPYIGSQARHILEFATVPVMVVPPPARDGRESTPPRPEMVPGDRGHR